MDIVRIFGQNLKKYRVLKGFSQEKFAEKCGLHRTYISDIECFRRSISLENIQRIADALAPSGNAYNTPVEVIALNNILQEWGVDDLQLLISGYQYKKEQK